MPVKPIRTYLLSAAIAAALILAYWPTFKWMGQRFSGADSYYGHGYLVPFIFAWLIYRKRDVHANELERLTQGGIWLSAAFFASAIVLNFLGHRLTVFFLSGLSIPLAIMGIGALLLNPGGMAKLWFPFAFLVSMVPLPNELLELVSKPLKTLVSNAAVLTVDGLGVPIILTGFEVQLRWGPLIVGNPCSGLRSLVSLLTLGALIAHLSPVKMAAKSSVTLMAIPIAILCNYCRIAFLLLYADKNGLASVAPGTLAHDGSGYVLFAAAFAALLFFSRWTEKRWPST